MPEALWVCRVKEFGPLIISIDTHGNNLFETNKAEFNRLNRHQLIIADPALNSLRIGGTFRPDNVEGFVRLLATTLEVRADPAGADRTILRRIP
jgi:hypothetical protein